MLFEFDLATIRLFNGLIVSKKDESHECAANGEGINRGIVYSSLIGSVYSDDMLTELSKKIGLSGSQLNAAFHKSWGKVQNTPDFILRMEQILHYITTYGFEDMGVFDNSTVYIPAEQLDIPEINLDKIEFRLIKGLTKEEILDKVMNLVGSGVALSEETQKDVMTILVQFKDDIHIDYNLVKNKELLIRMCMTFGDVPSKPEAFLRYVVYLATDNTLLIKNQETCDLIKAGCRSKYRDLSEAFSTYDKKYGLGELSSIFLRFKPLWLAFREHGEIRPMINTMRREAVNNHKPMQEDYINSVTARIKQGSLDLNLLKDALSKVNMFRKVRLANSLNYHIAGGTDIVYQVRNGKGFATKRDKVKSKSMYKLAFLEVMKSLAGDLGSVKGKTVYIPKGVHYALPSSEKKFVGNIPTGSYFEVEGNAVVGVHWFNTDQRVDLDLSLNSRGEKIGWDRNFTSHRGEVLFSGDVTSAPKPDGAMELFWINGRKVEGNYALNLNFFNRCDKSKEVPFSIVLGTKEGNVGDRFVYDINETKFKLDAIMDTQQKQIGYVSIKDGVTRLYLIDSNSGGGRTSRWEGHRDIEVAYYDAMLNLSIPLEALLEIAGANIINDLKDLKDGEEVLDLSPSRLQKDSLLKLFY